MSLMGKQNKIAYMKKIKLIIILIFMCILSACSINRNTVKKTSVTKTELLPTFKDTPTLYFHGLMGSYKNEEPLAQAAKKQGITTSVTRANVDKKGKVKLIGTIKKNAKNPLILVNYQDNVQPSFKRNGVYASNVVKALKKKYHINKVNMIGYSLGNMSIIYYQIQNGNKSSMPRLVKEVSLGGHYDGAYFKELPPGFRQPKGLKLDQNGKPNKMNQTYREMPAVRKIYQKHSVQVLNIFGNIGNQSDGVVETASAKSLKYLVADRNYQEFEVTADHGSLPSNGKVLQKTINFLW